MTYTVILHREAKKDIKKLHPQMRNRIISALDQISEDPKYKVQYYFLAILISIVIE